MGHHIPQPRSHPCAATRNRNRLIARLSRPCPLLDVATLPPPPLPPAPSLLLALFQEPLRLEAFSRCQGDALTRVKRVVREEWPQRVGTTVHDALRRQGAEGGANAAPSQGTAGSQSLEQVTGGDAARGTFVQQPGCGASTDVVHPRDR